VIHRVRFQAKPLLKYVLTKTLQSSAERRAICLDHASATRPGPRDSILEAIFTDHFGNLRRMLTARSCEQTHLPVYALFKQIFLFMSGTKFVGKTCALGRQPIGFADKFTFSHVWRE
jgi:hypothetical protein